MLEFEAFRQTLFDGAVSTATGSEAEADGKGGGGLGVGPALAFTCGAPKVLLSASAADVEPAVGASGVVSVLCAPSRLLAVLDVEVTPWVKPTSGAFEDEQAKVVSNKLARVAIFHPELSFRGSAMGATIARRGLLGHFGTTECELSFFSAC
jgi:hypothetical protein